MAGDVAMLEQEVTARSEDAPKPRRARPCRQGAQDLKQAQSDLRCPAICGRVTHAEPGVSALPEATKRNLLAPPSRLGK